MASCRSLNSYSAGKSIGIVSSFLFRRFAYLQGTIEIQEFEITETTISIMIAILTPAKRGSFYLSSMF